MEKVSKRKQTVLDALDEQIEELEEKLQRVQPLINELHSLKRARAALLDERSPTGGGGRANAQITMEQVIHDLKENGASTPQEIAGRLHVGDSVVRSHLNRHNETRYRKLEDGKWDLIGDEDDEEDE